jgi:hypothetical protein
LLGCRFVCVLFSVSKQLLFSTTHFILINGTYTNSQYMEFKLRYDLRSFWERWKVKKYYIFRKHGNSVIQGKELQLVSLLLSSINSIQVLFSSRLIISYKMNLQTFSTLEMIIHSLEMKRNFPNTHKPELEVKCPLDMTKKKLQFCV